MKFLLRNERGMEGEQVESHHMGMAKHTNGWKSFDKSNEFLNHSRIKKGESLSQDIFFTKLRLFSMIKWCPFYR
jgi:hypothetical protein